MDYVTIYWDGRPRAMERHKLETAWLVLQEIPEEGFYMNRLKSAASALQNNYGFKPWEAKEYAIAARSWEPD